MKLLPKKVIDQIGEWVYRDALSYFTKTNFSATVDYDTNKVTLKPDYGFVSMPWERLVKFFQFTPRLIFKQVKPRYDELTYKSYLIASGYYDSFPLTIEIDLQSDNYLSNDKIDCGTGVNDAFIPCHFKEILENISSSKAIRAGNNRSLELTYRYSGMYAFIAPNKPVRTTIVDLLRLQNSIGDQAFVGIGDPRPCFNERKIVLATSVQEQTFCGSITLN